MLTAVSIAVCTACTIAGYIAYEMTAASLANNVIHERYTDAAFDAAGLGVFHFGKTLARVPKVSRPVHEISTLTGTIPIHKTAASMLADGILNNDAVLVRSATDMLAYDKVARIRLAQAEELRNKVDFSGVGLAGFVAAENAFES